MSFAPGIPEQTARGLHKRVVSLNLASWNSRGLRAAQLGHQLRVDRLGGGRPGGARRTPPAAAAALGAGLRSEHGGGALLLGLCAVPRGANAS